MLEVRDLHAYYGKSHILQGVDMVIDAGEVVSLLGRNGVGRSTTVKAIMGEVPPQGSIKFKGHRRAGADHFSAGRRPDRQHCRRGVAILLVEQKLSVALRISHRVYVMGHGRIVFEGTPAELKANEAIRKEWLEV